MMQSPPQKPPPQKKQRGGATPDNNSKLAQHANDAIASRRQELARLQQSFQKRPTFAAPSSGGSGASGPPSSTTTSGPPPILSSGSAPPVGMPPARHRVEPRKSDLFPSAPKSASSAGETTLAAMATAAAAATAPPPVARRLHDNFDNDPDNKNNNTAPPRASSAPPPTNRRPPPPPPPGSGNAPPPPRAPGSGGVPKPPPQKVDETAARSYVGRPQPVTPSAAAAAPPVPAATTTSHRVTSPAPSDDGSKTSKGAPPPPSPGAPPPTAALPKAAETTGGPPRVSMFPPSGKPKTTTFAPSPQKEVVIHDGAPAEEEGGGHQQSVVKAFAGSTPFPKQKNKSHTMSTPYVKTSIKDAPPPDTVETPPTARRDMLRDMRDSVPDASSKPGPPHIPSMQHSPAAAASSGAMTSPHQSSKTTTMHEIVSPRSEEFAHQQSSAELRIQKELAQAQKEKAGALRDLAVLEEELEKYKQQAQKAQEAAAAASRNVGLFSPLAPASLPINTPAPGAGLASPLVMQPQLQQSPGRGARRVPTPHPKKKRPLADLSAAGEPLDDDDDDEAIMPFLREAATVVPFEYETTDLATFFVRRPYGVETNQELWYENGQVPTKVYQAQATARHMETIEVVALIPADASKLVLHDKDSVRHGNRDGSWQEFPPPADDETTEALLGNVTYIDSEANEQVYSLDTVYESARAVRELYCSSLLSTAVGLEQKQQHQQQDHGRPPRPEQASQQQPPPNAPPPMMPAPVEKKPPTTNACVGTEDMPYNPPQKAVAPPPKSAPAPAPTKPVESEDDNVMGVFLSMVISLLWTLLVQLPWRIASTVFTLVVAVFLTALVWMYLADQHGALHLGGPPPVAQLFNPPGIV